MEKYDDATFFAILAFLFLVCAMFAMWKEINLLGYLCLFISIICAAAVFKDIEF